MELEIITQSLTESLQCGIFLLWIASSIINKDTVVHNTVVPYTHESDTVILRSVDWKHQV